MQLRDVDIYPNLYDEIIYGYDQVCINHPELFATVNFYLNSTVTLDKIIDQMRIEKGLLPVLPDDDCGDWDDSGWYDFYVGLNDFSETHVDSAIMAVIRCENADDNESVYYIDLTPEEQHIVYSVLNEMCQNELGKTCEDLLREARESMDSCLHGDPYTLSI